MISSAVAEFPALMAERILICTDLDRTLIPNGPQSESSAARERFRTLVQRPEVTLAYVSGRHRALIQQAIINYSLPSPDFVIGDVGTTLYQTAGRNSEWTTVEGWEHEIARDWAGHSHADIKSFLSGLSALRLQEPSKQNVYKLSYYVPLQTDQQALTEKINQRLNEHAIAARQIWSIDEPAGVGLLDILPVSASKFHAINALMDTEHFTLDNTVFCGDSGNDIGVLASPIQAVLVGNAKPEVRQLAVEMATADDNSDSLYTAQGGYLKMNGNYSGGMLEGIAHYFPFITPWIEGETQERQS